MDHIKTIERISQLLYNQAIGTISESERAELDQWAKERPERQEYINPVSSPDFLEKEYHLLKDVDSHRALEQMRQRIRENGLSHTLEGICNPRYPRWWGFAIPTTHHPSLYRIAAAIVLLLVAGGLVWYTQYTKVTPPEISQEVLTAMQRSVQSGRAIQVSQDDASESKEQGARSEKGNPSQAETEEGNLSPLTSYHLPLEEDFDLMAARRVTTYHNKEFWLTLDDGTLVHLNYNTRVIYPEKFGRKKREVILDGEAYFMVAKDRSRPFIVHTAGGDVKVYGTEFFISTKSDDTGNSSTRQLVNSSTSITLIKGSVGVTPTGGTEQKMLPGQQCSILNAQCSRSDVDTEPYVAWNQGVYVFEDCTLERLMNVLSHWYGYEVVFKDEKARQKKFTGELDKYSSFRPVLNAISSVTDINFTINGNTIVIQE